MIQKREVLFRDDFLNSVKAGVDTLADSVKTTMGPKGKLVLIQRVGKHPTVTKDGVTVANAINLRNEVENLGVEVIREAASRTADEAGDGTTTATVLAQSIFNEGLKMQAAGFQTDMLVKGIQAAGSKVENYFNEKRKEIKSKKELQQVALISANGEKEIADLIVEALGVSGVDGSIIVEEAKGFKSDLTVVEGLRLERGYLSPYFVTDKNKMSADYNNCLILLADREFATIQDLVKPMELALECSKPLLVIANDMSGDALQGVVLNKTKGILRVCAIKSPGFGTSRHEMLNDLQSVVGGNIVDASFNMSEFKMEDFGVIKKAHVSKNMTMLISDSNSNKPSAQIEKRITAIKSRMKDPGLDRNELDLLRYRLQQLSGGISILRVGAATESELIERYDRVDDALHATKAAMQEGVLPGGGVALVRSVSALDSIKKDFDPSFEAGVNIMKRSLLEPFKQIIRNGRMSPDAILAEVFDKKENTGYDAREEKMVDMFKSGILDPHKVVRCALQNAISAATMLLNVGCCMIDVE